jgi:hypothetical protein
LPPFDFPRKAGPFPNATEHVAAESRHAVPATNAKCLANAAKHLANAAHDVEH